MGPDQQSHYQHLDRRGFLRTSAAFALMAGLGGQHNLLATSGLAPKRSIADLHFADFHALVGQSFRVYMPGSAANFVPRSVKLVAVKNQAQAANRTRDLRNECFSLAFSGPKDQAFPQGTYTFAHPHLGRFDLFVVPTMSVAHEERHIGIINRI